jgi:hypothetical protein
MVGLGFIGALLYPGINQGKKDIGGKIPGEYKDCGKQTDTYQQGRVSPYPGLYHRVSQAGIGKYRFRQGRTAKKFGKSGKLYHDSRNQDILKTVPAKGYPFVFPSGRCKEHEILPAYIQELPSGKKGDVGDPCKA